jgi:hypothetical protein
MDNIRFILKMIRLAFITAASIVRNLIKATITTFLEIQNDIRNMIHLSGLYFGSILVNSFNFIINISKKVGRFIINISKKVGRFIIRMKPSKELRALLLSLVILILIYGSAYETGSTPEPIPPEVVSCLCF